MSPACTDSNRNHEHRSIPRGKDTRQRTFTRPWLVANYCMGQCDVATVGSRSGVTHISWWVHWRVEEYRNVVLSQGWHPTNLGGNDVDGTQLKCLQARPCSSLEDGDASSPADKSCVCFRGPPSSTCHGPLAIRRLRSMAAWRLHLAQK